MVKRGHHVPPHFQQKHGQRKHGGKDQRFFECVALCRLALGRGVFHGLALTRLGHWRCFVTGLGNGGNQRAHVGAVADLHAGAFGGQVHHGVLHARHFFQRPFHTAYAGCASHAIHLQIHVLRWNGVTGFFNRSHRQWQHSSGLRGVIHRQAGFLGGQVDHRVLHTGHFFERTLHPAHTGCAGHSFHRQLESARLAQCIHHVLHSHGMHCRD